MKPHFLAVLGLGLLLAGSQLAAEETGSITVNGKGTVEVKPDIARVRMAVVERNESLEYAQEAVAKVTVGVLQLLDNMDIDRKLITTIGASVRPNYRWNRETEQQELLGYIAERNIEIELRDLDKLGDLVEGAVKAGVNQIYPPTLDYADRGNAYRQALARAAEDARANATTLARALDSKVGRTLDITTLSNKPGPVPLQGMRAEAMAADSAPQSYSVGNITLEATVTARFELVN